MIDKLLRHENDNNMRWSNLDRKKIQFYYEIKQLIIFALGKLKIFLIPTKSHVTTPFNGIGGSHMLC